ncbi:MAG: sensor histidine kinase [Prevotella sp.]
MKLINYISLRLFAIAAVVLTFWSVLFYFAIIDEINDETDDSLEDYAELVIKRYLSGEKMPTTSISTNNQYYLHEVTAGYADSVSHVRYADSEVYIKYKHEYEPARSIAYIFMTDSGRYYEVVVYVPTIDKDDLKEMLFYWIMFLSIAIMICIATLNVFMVRRSMRPLYNLLRAMDAYRLGHGSTVGHNPTRISEFSHISDAVSRLMIRSDKLYANQKIFIGNASHEMQTPIAACKNRLELLLEEGGLNEMQAGEIVRTLNTLNSLSKLNRSLLMLCKIENGQYSDVETVDMAGIVAPLVDDLQTVFADKHISVEQTVDAPWLISMSKQLSRVFVSNVLKNAFVHNVEGGVVKIRIYDGGMTVSNTATGRPLDTSRIYTQFYHTPGNKSSMGLGMSLVKAVCDFYSIDIHYRFDDGLHVFEFRSEGV